MSKKIAIIGVALASLFFIGVVVGILNALHFMLTEKIVISPERSAHVVAGLVSEKLVPGMQLIILSMPAFLISVVILVASSCREKWYFWCMFWFSMPYIIVFPVGTVLATTTYAYLFIKRKAFLNT